MFKIHIEEFSGETFSLSKTLDEIFNKQGVLLHSGLEKQKNLFHIVGKNPIFSIKKNGIFYYPFERDFLFSDIFVVLQKILNKKFCKKNKLIPFCGGIIGYIAYDYVYSNPFFSHQVSLKRFWENIDLLDFVFFQNIDIWSTLIKKKWCIQQFVTKEFLDFLELESTFLKKTPEIGENIWKTSSDSRDFYESAVESAIQKIRKGIVYEINISRQICGETNSSCHQLAEKMFLTNPTNQESYWKSNDFSLISTSPEVYFQTKKRDIVSIPIKGTISSKKNSSCLLKDPKIQAELSMTVDLLRNDFHMFCIPGTVKVENFLSIESFINVHQTTAKVSGTMDRKKNWIDMLRYGFPPASIVGCPRIEAINLINSLESFPRGLYTGCLGYACYCGNSSWSVLIRSIFFQKNRYIYRVGGGITVDSDPEKEYWETTYKEETLQKIL